MVAFEGKTVVVAGASGNLGAAVAEAFYTAGAQLALIDRNGERVQELFGDRERTVQIMGAVDLTDPDQINAAIEKIVADHGKIDIAVSTVGGYRAGSALHETPIETFDFMLNLNARTFYLLSQAVLPGMLAEGSGKIVGVSARAGLAGGKNMAAYSASKAAMIRLVESMAAEYKASGINVNCVLPGTIDTPQNREAMPNADPGRWVQPASLADVILFLASDRARDVHGVALPVYGAS